MTDLHHSAPSHDGEPHHGQARRSGDRELYEARATAGQMRLAAMALIEGLRPDQQALAMMPLEDASERRDWDFVPKVGRHGLRLRDMDRIRRAGIEKIHFAWAGQLERGQPHYYRLQGPDLPIEFDNTQSSGNHIHTVVRTPSDDFGDDLLQQHYAEDHPNVRAAWVTSTRP